MRIREGIIAPRLIHILRDVHRERRTEVKQTPKTNMYIHIYIYIIERWAENQINMIRNK